MTYLVEMNAAQMKFIREFFDNYKDDVVTLTIKDDSNRVRTVYTAETELDKSALEKHLKNEFKTRAKMASALYYAIHVK